MVQKIKAAVLALLALALAPIARYAERTLVCWAYAGSTAGATSANPPMLIAKTMAGRANTTGGTTSGGMGGGLWLYYSTNPSSDLYNTNFFSDAYYLGMKNGDVVMGIGCTGSSGLFTIGVMGAVTTAGGALSTGTIITSTFV